MVSAKHKHNYLALQMFYPYIKYHHHGSSPFSINFFSFLCMYNYMSYWKLDLGKKNKEHKQTVVA